MYQAKTAHREMKEKLQHSLKFLIFFKEDIFNKLQSMQSGVADSQIDPNSIQKIFNV